MSHDYRLVSPSLDGLLDDAVLTYEGLKRPIELLRVLDGPAAKGRGSKGRGDFSDSSHETPQNEDVAHKKQVLEQYFHDLYGIFMKRLSFFVVESEVLVEDAVKLQAMLQEMIKVKKLL